MNKKNKNSIISIEFFLNFLFLKLNIKRKSLSLMISKNIYTIIYAILEKNKLV